LEFLRSQLVEESGKTRISMGGLAQDLHIRNLQWQYLTELKKKKEELEN
jgi:hypothetical protein